MTHRRARAPGPGAERPQGRPGRGVSMTDVTRILSAIEQGDALAAEQLLPLVYDELRKLAAQKLAREKPGRTLLATALVHEPTCGWSTAAGTGPGMAAATSPPPRPGPCAASSSGTP